MFLRKLTHPISDHCPLLLETGLEDWRPPPFIFELMCLSEKGLGDSVRIWWEDISVEWGWVISYLKNSNSKKEDTRMAKECY